MKLIVFDTNAWLDLYLIHPVALEEIIAKFSVKKDLFWIPEQVYWEYGNNLSDKRDEALGVIKNASITSCGSIDTTKAGIIKLLTNLKNNSIIPDDSLSIDIGNQLDTIRKKVKHELKSLNIKYQKELTIIDESTDIVHKLIEDIYTSNPPFFYTNVQRIDLYEEGEKRVKYHIPPGLTDTDKKDSDPEKVYRRRYGDFLIWKDILRKTEELTPSLKKGEILHVVFVENEKKGDWWISRGKPVIAPTLKEEFDHVASGKAEIEMISFDDFLSIYSVEFDIGKRTVSQLVEKNRYKESVIEEIKCSKRKVLEDCLRHFFSDSKKFKELFKRNSYFGGVFDSVTGFRLKIMDCDDVEVIDRREIKLVGELLLEYSGKLTETVDNKKEQFGIITDTITDTIEVGVSVEILIDYSQGYETNHYDIGSVEVEEIKTYSNRKYQSSSYKRKKEIVFARDNYTCQMCGRTSEDGSLLVLDHILPVRYGGSDEISNLQTLCRKCNAIKADKIMQSYTTCPDCGCYIYSWNDGGNGFCAKCAPNH